MDGAAAAAQSELSSREFSHYFGFFHHLNPSGCPLGGARGRNVFLHSRLPPAVLSQIWQLADIDRDGRLSTVEFAVAMHLVRLALDGVSPPSSLSPPLLVCVRQVVESQLPLIEDKHVLKCQTAFSAFKADVATGVLGMEATKYLFTKSNLSQGQLYHIWRLADRDGDGRLVFLEFTVAMHLIFLTKLGRHLPLSLDPTSLLPPLYYKIVKEAQEKATQAPPPPGPAVVTSDLFPPPNTPLESAHDSDFTMAFTEDLLLSLPPEEDDESEPDPFLSTAQSTSSAEDDVIDLAANGLNGEHSGRGFVIDSDEADAAETDVTEKERVRVEMALELQEPMVLQTAPFTSIMSPPAGQLMMPQVVMAPRDLGGALEEGERVGEGEGDGERVGEGEGDGEREEGEGEEEEEEWEDGVVEEQLIIEEEEEEEKERGVGEAKRQEQVHAELENLSLASRQFLKESQNRLWEQQRRNLEPSYPNSPGMDQYRQASVKGLSATIAEMEGGEQSREVDQTDNGSEPEFGENGEDWQEVGKEGVGGAESDGGEEGGAESDGVEEGGAESDGVEEGGADGVEEGGAESDGVEEGGAESDGGEGKGEEKRRRGPEESLDLFARFDDLEAEIENALEGTQLEEEEEEEEEGESEGVESWGTTSSSATGSGTNFISSLSEMGGAGGGVSEGGAPHHPGTSGAERQKRSARVPAYQSPLQTRVAARLKELTPPPQRRPQERRRGSSSEEDIMEDLDSFLQNEIESINDMFQEFQTQDQQLEQRQKDEEIKIMTKEVSEVVNEGPKVSGIEEVTARRMKESADIERRYQQEMARLEQEKLREDEEEIAVKQMTLDSDAALNKLDKEWEDLLAQEEVQLRDAQKEKVRREKREQEERERKERERKERATEQEMTVEEWISWMEEKKKQGMSSEQQLEYEHRKRAWMEREKERVEKRRKEDDEKIRKNRERMEEDYRAFQARDREVKERRLSSTELQQLQEEATRKEAEERRAREEKKKKQHQEVNRAKDMEQLKPKASSALAAKWEEQVRSKRTGKKR